MNLETEKLEKLYQIVKEGKHPKTGKKGLSNFLTEDQKQFDFNKTIQTDELKWVFKSILDIGDADSEWKADLIEFINSDSHDQSSMFFYDMLPFVRFIDEPSDAAAAFTTPDKKIWLNAPKGFGVGKAYMKWEFIYFHECMHQLWDTFDVKRNIERQFGSCDMEILNIASDCVINDFLHINKKMPYPTDGLVTPEYIKDNYGVEYDRRRDTQFALYEKLLKAADEIRKKQPPKQPNDDSDDHKTPQPKQPKQQPKMQSDEFVKGWNQAMEDYAKGLLPKDLMQTPGLEDLFKKRGLV